MKREGGGEGRKRTSERQKEGRDWAGQRGLQGTQMRGQRKRGGRLWPGEGESARTWGRQELTETTGSWGGGSLRGGGHSHEMVSIRKQCESELWLRGKDLTAGQEGHGSNSQATGSSSHLVLDVGWASLGSLFRRPISSSPGRPRLWEGEAAEGSGPRRVLSQVREVQGSQVQPGGIWPQPCD